MPTAPSNVAPDPVSAVIRIEVRPASGHADPIADSLKHDAAALGFSLAAASATHIYLIEPAAGSPISPSQTDRLRSRLLADPITETSRLGAAAPAQGACLIEVHPLPGVMDPVAESVRDAIRELLGLTRPPEVATGWRYDLRGPGLTPAAAREIAERLLANPVIHRIHSEAFHPSRFPTGNPHDGGTRAVPLASLSDAQLKRLSRDAHLFLSPEEMQAIQVHFREKSRDPREIELETLAQTWSEHCIHKTFKSTIRYSPSQGMGVAGWGGSGADPLEWSNRPNHEPQPDGSVIIRNLFKSTIVAATRGLIAGGIDWTLSVFSDNSGVIAFDGEHAVCAKVETHNHPSAIEPYGGAATGIGGCIRDVMGTGLGARPIANTDVFCVAPPNLENAPAECIPPRRLLSQVVAGVRDFGNRMGIPTVSGAVAFDDRYIGNPLVFCGCIGVMRSNRVHGGVKPGDRIVALGGRTGRDGIHGATFSSAELEHTASDEFAHAVQIGNAITQKRVLDALLRARDEFPEPLYHALTDCGAGGFSSAIGELGKGTGATVHLERALLKYPGLSPTEIWISEAQERMVLAVPPDRLAALENICKEEGVETAVLGEFAPPEGSTRDNPDLVLRFRDREIGRLSMRFLHDGVPLPTLEATWTAPGTSNPDRIAPDAPTISAALLRLLADPNIASKHWIIRQYDHEVRGATAVKPLVGPRARGPGDASIIKPVPGSKKGLAISCGLRTGVGDSHSGGDPYLMALETIDECVRNLVCVGADPERIAILDNFCWPGCGKPENLGALVRAAEGCYDGAIAYRTPFISGKDSLNNQFTAKDGRTIEIPPTLLITGIGIMNDVRRACTADAKSPGNTLILVGRSLHGLGGSHFQRLFGLPSRDETAARVPRADLKHGPATARAAASIIAAGLARSAHDVSDGGLLVAIAEMLIGGSTASRPIGAVVDLSAIGGDPAIAAFGESPSRYVLEIDPAHLPAVNEVLRKAGVDSCHVGGLDNTGELTSASQLFEPLNVEELAGTWLAPLDW